MNVAAHRWNVTREQYHADRDHVSSSALRRFLDSHQLYRLHQLGLVSEDSDSAALAIGSAVHANWLEPDVWLQEWAYQPYFGDGRTTAAKEKKLEWESFANGRRILENADAQIACNSVKALLANPWAEALRKAGGENEVPIRWECPATGVWCRALIDMHRPTRKIVADLKTIAGQPTPKNIREAIEERRYDLQAAHYLAGCREVFGEDYDWIWIFVGKSAPHVAVVHSLDERTRIVAERQRLEILQGIRRCSEADDWLESIGRPEWALRREEA